MLMVVFQYDKSFEGLLCAVFEAYDKKKYPESLISQEQIVPLLTREVFAIETQTEKFLRVLTLLKNKMSVMELNRLNAVWLSEIENSDFLLFQYIKYAIDSKFEHSANFGHPVVLEIHKIAKKVSKEVHAWQQFVRFQKSKDEIYFAPVHPVYNSLPLVIPHFKDRFSSQQWILYDLKRNYGFYYDLSEVHPMVLEGSGEHLRTGFVDEEMLHPDEKLFQELWKKYHTSVSIKERINLKLQKQYMPKRYWKFLTEKQ